MPNISLICTVLNEKKTILSLLKSISTQSRLPNEVIIVDGGSSDGTFEILKKARRTFPHLKLRIYRHSSGRSAGRNFAIQKAGFNTIAITDAGCVLDTDWLQELAKMLLRTGADVVSGYYRAEPETPFEEAVVPYVLVMPDQLDPLSFLPATRSMLLKKSVFETVGFFDETLEVSEDYEFAHRLKRASIERVFAQEATVIWKPRQNLLSFFRMVVSMSKGDVLGGVIRPKALLVVVRYVFFVLLFLLGLYVMSAHYFLLLGVSLGLYSLWAIWKNHTYVSAKAYGWLLVLQFTADIGVLLGMVQGLLRR